MNYLKYKVCWWIWLPMGSLKKFSRVVLMTTLGKKNYMQISAAIIENRTMQWSNLHINIFAQGCHEDNPTRELRYSWSNVNGV